MAAAQVSPISLLIVAAVLFLFRKIYAEVVGALPLNGGAYNALLNTTSKSRASIAACLTLLSYMATAVISGLEAVHYALPGVTPAMTLTMTIGLLAVFMVLVIIGITESAKVAIGIFILHLLTLGLLMACGVIWVISHGGGELVENFKFDEHPLQRQMIIQAEGLAAIRAELKPESRPEELEPDTVFADVKKSLTAGSVPDELRIFLEKKQGLLLPKDRDVNPKEADGDSRQAWIIGDGSVEVRADTGQGRQQLQLMTRRGLWAALFFGFCAAMLGISGFESSANFVEEQRQGVFPKTLRNMWIAVSILNPAMALLTLSILRVDEVGFHKNHLLAHLGEVAAGGWLGVLVRVDAVLVLSGAVLTSYVGVTGLIHRMTLDRCLPQFLLKRNRARGTTHRIIIAFFLLAVSVLLITGGSLEALAGVYTLSFLAVMVLFAVGNILLKVYRERLPRPARASWPFVIIGLLAVVAALIGNAVEHPDYAVVFLYYFVPTLLFVMIMLGRIRILRVILGMVKNTANWASRVGSETTHAIEAKIEEINSQQIVFFTRGDKVDNLRRAVEYVLRNESTNRIKIVTVAENPATIPKQVKRDLDVLDLAYPEIEIEYVAQEGTFGPALIDSLSEKWGVPKNLMFIGSHGSKFKYDQGTLGGVRLII